MTIELGLFNNLTLKREIEELIMRRVWDAIVAGQNCDDMRITIERKTQKIYRATWTDQDETERE